tara:strand:+ start:1625 stop:2371 length:747 start_codon:yes stop_codon:yes gene_type:complete
MIVKRKNSGIIIIGDEILSGKTQDKNSRFLSKELGKRGVDVLEISVIPDIEDEIIKKVKSFSSNYDYVFTTGGIGPTHDDITALSVSRAFKLKYEQNKEAKKILEKHYKKKELTKARQKMSFMPRGATLIYNPVSAAPGFIIKNVYVLPGVPMILKPMVLEYLTNYFTINILPQVRISTKLSEGIIGEFIGQIQKNNKQVTIGSYPYFKNDNFGVSLIMKSENRRILDQVSKKVYSYLKKKSGNPKYF